MDKRFAVILVQSTSHAIRGEHLLTRAGIPCKLVPVPRTLSSDCGVCLRIAPADRARALGALQEGRLEVVQVHDI